MTKNRITAAMIILGWVLLFSGCNPGTVFQESSPIPSENWHLEHVAGFEASVSDTSSLHKLYLEVRNTTDYPYSNLYLFLDIEFPDGRILRDTIECMLAERSGRWTGKGFGRIKSNAFLFRDDVWFPEAGIYSFRIRHGMREESLPGISDIGIRIDRK